MPDRLRITRRRFLAASAAGAAVPLVGCSDDDAEPSASPAAGSATPPPTGTPVTGSPRALAPTPACGDEDEPTIAQTEGPYFTPNSPERASLLESGMAGQRLVVQGRVLSSGCEPIANALLDFWQCDNDGIYDNEGFRLRGHQFTGDDGAYALETILPGLYPGRTRHIHVKVQRPGGSVLTTQLYFPDEPANATDGIFDPSLVVTMQQAASGLEATFDFVVA